MIGDISPLDYLKMYGEDKFEDFILNKKSKNRRIVASCIGVIKECKGMRKCMITFTPRDGKSSTIKKLRTQFFEILSNKKSNKNGDKSIKYISNIEFSKKNNIPHIHIVIFFKNEQPIINAYNELLKKNNMNKKSNDIKFEKDGLKIHPLYIIKDYRYFNLELEVYKHSYFKNFRFFSSSRKSIPRNIILYLYKELKFKTKDKYEEILELIDKKQIIITTDKNLKYKFSKTLLISEKLIGENYVFIFKKVVLTYKIKVFVKNRKKGKIKYVPRKKSIILDI